MISSNRHWRHLLAASLLLTPACLPSADEEARCGIPETTFLLGDGSKSQLTQAELASEKITLKANLPSTIYFTLDGTPPKLETADCKNGPTFCGESPVSNIPVIYDGMALQYFAVDRCGNQERIQTQFIRVDLPPVTTADPAPGLYNTAITVRLTSVDEAEDASAPTIYWTQDGSAPDPSNTNAQMAVGVAEIALANSATLKWRGIDASGNAEAEKTGQYTIDTVPPISIATPESGFFDGSVDVLVKIQNDTGTLYLSDNGAVPVKNDANGHTIVASLQTTRTLEASAFLRFTAVDKAGNAEHEAGEFNEEVYIIDDEPAVIATPPGGDYSAGSLTVTIKAAPESTAVIKYGIDAPATNNYTGPIEISGNDGADVVLNIQVTRSDLPALPAVNKSETYRLGAAGATQNFVEDFSSLSFIDTDKTTAIIDTDEQTASIPNFSFSQIESIPNDIDLPNVQMGPQFGWAKATLYNEGVAARTVAVLDGFYNGVPASGQNAVGLKLYTWTSGSDDAPDLTYRGQWFTATPATPDIAMGADLLLAGSPPTLPVAVVATLGDQVAFVNIADPANPVSIATLNDFQFSRGGESALLAQTADNGKNFVFVARQANSGVNTLAALDLDVTSATVSVAGEITLTTTVVGSNRDIVALAIDPSTAILGNSRLLALTGNCALYRVDFTTVASPTTSLVSSAVCPSGAVAHAMVAADIGFVNNYAWISYSLDGVGNVASVDLGFDDINILGAIRHNLLAAAAPADDIWDIDLLFNDPINSAERLLAIVAGNQGVQLFDLSNVEATSLPLLDKSTISGFELDGLARYVTPDSEEILFTGLRDSIGTGFPPVTRGGVASYKAAGAPQSAVVQSKNFNSTASKVKTIKLQSVDSTPAGASICFSTNGSDFSTPGCIAAGQQKTVSPAADNIYWRSTLTLTGATELNNVNILMGLE